LPFILTFCRIGTALFMQGILFALRIRIFTTLMFTHMKKFNLLFSFILLASASWVFAQNATEIAPETEQKPAEKVLFEKITHDFGTLNEGDPAMEVFKFKNVSNEEIVLQNVKASCGCTTPKWTNTPVPPGGEGEIQVSYGTAGRPGPFNKSVTVTLDTLSQPIFLYIKGDVIKKPESAEEVAPMENNGHNHDGHNHDGHNHGNQPPKHSQNIRMHSTPNPSPSYNLMLMAHSDVKFNRMSNLKGF